MMPMDVTIKINRQYKKVLIVKAFELTQSDLVDILYGGLLHVVLVDGLVELHVAKVDDGRQNSEDGIHFIVVEAEGLEPVHHLLELVNVALKHVTGYCNCCVFSYILILFLQLLF